MFDIAIIGAGPAGYSAALSARKRGKAVAVVGSHGGWLARAERVDNYPGLPGVSGAALLEAMRAQAQALGAALLPGLARQAVPMGGTFAVSLGADFVEARRLILCTGARQPKLLPGEEALLGRGVSYCGTCDGMLYRGKRVAVLGESREAAAEASFLAGLCAGVDFYGAPPEGLDARVHALPGKPEALLGESRCEGLRVDGESRAYDGVFIFRETMALSALLPGIETVGAFIRVDRGMRASVPGVFAAGDCTGAPFQVAKAVGEGCVAALSACEGL